MELKDILNKYKEGELSMEDALAKMPDGGIEDLGFAVIDTHRERRTGHPEIIYGSGKTVEQVTQIAERMQQKGINVLATKVSAEMAEAMKKIFPEAEYNAIANTIQVKKQEQAIPDSYIAIVAAGTSDMSVAEEAAETATFLGNKVERIYDVGVAGIHRLFNRLELIRGARVIIVVAGMEGALTSVVGGLVDKPVIGVPTSVGYGANFQGLSALLAMLNSCASGVSVVNIDNGFGAACQASLINKI
ncbi:MAG: nickel pincer cofactor biosynthesis protein LarB [Spirochaetales bacterium]|jgi:NCAIR mutase (PurE)-related protein|nr:nickel pincer cofactor biosynthesis protein LarB [Spirochaetales bacterium]